MQLVLRKHGFEDPEDVVRLLTQEMTPLCQERNETFHALHMQASRNWHGWLADIGSNLKGAFRSRQGVWAPHSFTFKMRQDLLTHERQALLESKGSQVPQGQNTHCEDVICMVKNYMHDEKISQAELVFPEAFQPRLIGPYPSEITPSYKCDPLKKKNYENLAAQLLLPHSYYPRAADYIKGLLHSREGNQVALPRLTWLRRETKRPAPVTVPSGNRHYPHLPQTTWSLETNLRW